MLSHTFIYSLNLHTIKYFAMNRDRTQLLRLIFIDRKIREGMRSGCLANCRSMAEEYEVSAKSILRDIDYLKNQRDAPIVYDATRKGYIYSEENYALPALNVTESDLFAICIAEQALQPYRQTPLYEKLRKVFDKIEESLPDRVQLSPLAADSRILFMQKHQSFVAAKIWETISTSLQHSKTTRLFYTKSGNTEAVDRLVDPYQLVSFDGQWYLYGHCHRRGKPLTFALSRISKVTITDDHFAPPPVAKIRAILENSFGIYSGDKEWLVSIEFQSTEALYVEERQWHPSQIIEKKDTGELVLSFPSGNLEEIRRWVLSWGAGACVVRPEILKELMREELAAMLKLYSHTKDAQ